MSKTSELMDARLQGMDYALRTIKEIGVEAFEKELQTRCNHKIAHTVSQQAINEASDNIKAWCYETVACLFYLGLRDEFDFGKKRINRLNNRMTEKVRCLNENFVTWDDYKQILQDELGVKVDMAWER